MKKRKVKLFASIASLAMVVAVMGVGVWAATNQSVAVSSEVKFQATSIAAQVDLKVTNGEGTMLKSAFANVNPEGVEDTTYEANIMTTQTTIADFAIDTPVTAYKTAIQVELQADANGKLAKDNTIVYTFTITPDASTPAIYYLVETDHNNSLFDVTISAAKNWTSGEALGAGLTGETTITVTYKMIKDHYETIKGAESEWAVLGDISIKMSNADQADEILGYVAPVGV